MSLNSKSDFLFGFFMSLIDLKAVNMNDRKWLILPSFLIKILVPSFENINKVNSDLW